MHNLLESSNVKFASVATDISVHHYKRATAAGLWKQMHAFAVGRARLGRRDRTFLKPSHVFVAFGVPTILLILSVGGLVMPMIWFCAGTAAGVGMVFFFATAVRCS